MQATDVILVVICTVLVANTAVSLLVSVTTLMATMTLLRYARKSDELLDKIILVCQQLGKSLELAIWRG